MLILFLFLYFYLFLLSLIPNPTSILDTSLFTPFFNNPILTNPFLLFATLSPLSHPYRSPTHKYKRMQLGRHVDALTTLVREVHDPTSAEAYCMLGVGTDGGEVVSSKVASAIAERCSSGASSTTITGMDQWATFVVILSSSSTTPTTKRTIDEETRKGLLKILLGVYMSGSGVGPNKEKGDEGALIGMVKGDGEKEEDEKEEEKRRLATTRLLNSQAGKFDVVDVCKLSFTFRSIYFLTLFYFI